MSMAKLVQAKDVPELLVLQALALPNPRAPAHPRWCLHWPGFDNSLATLEPELARYPEKVLHAKLCAMQRRGLIDGCTCGVLCRGDWHITVRGVAYLGAMLMADRDGCFRRSAAAQLKGCGF